MVHLVVLVCTQGLCMYVGVCLFVCVCVCVCVCVYLFELWVGLWVRGLMGGGGACVYVCV